MTIWLTRLRHRAEPLNHVWAQQYAREVGESPFCVHFDPVRPAPLDSCCTALAEIKIVHWGLGVSDVPDTWYCRACAQDLLDELQGAIEMVDALDDPRREAGS
jgi:hypothetical protein